MATATGSFKIELFHKEVDMNRNGVWIVAAVVAIVILVVGGCALDQQRRAANAAEKVAEFVAECDSAKANFDNNYDLAVDQWGAVTSGYSGSHYLGNLLTSPTAMVGQIEVVCAGAYELDARLENGDDRVDIYNDAESSLERLARIVVSPLAERAIAQDALAELQSAESWRAEAYSRYENAPWDAVDLNAAYDELGDGDASLQYGWDAMFWSDWGLANLSGGYAIGWYQLAIEHSSSPTPTPEPTNTPEPTDTPEPEPYQPPPTIDWSTSSDQSGSTDDTTSTDGYTDSGVFDDPASDAGAFDDPPEEPVNTDSGSWKAPVLVDEPRRK